ncbi:PilN domain-containing protein [Breoghania sp.]|uniref:PilN domain-containing protein n=1 Tax=Breoghania sp. TaxID=2065378 RepID=UPI00260675B5|nr:PilN domain-containing protein [Breoghania sp.]MDJ0929776.1 PilN domain-containing protein [Breoghania sp.]
METVILRRDLVLSVLLLARENGLDIGALVFDGVSDRRALELMKLETSVDRMRRRWKRLNAALLGISILLAGATGGLAYWQCEAALETVTTRLEAAKSRTIRLRREQAEAVAAYDATVVLVREKVRTSSVDVVWNAFSEVLPDTIFLSGLEFSGTSGRISGFAKSAAPLIERLEALDKISGVAFASPVMINPDDHLERFDITFDLATGSGETPSLSVEDGGAR